MNDKCPECKSTIADGVPHECPAELLALERSRREGLVEKLESEGVKVTPRRRRTTSD